MSCGKVGIIGSGVIGRSWALIFLSGGFDVYLYDTNPEVVNSAMEQITEQILLYDREEVLRGSLNASEQISHLHKAGSLVEAISDAIHVQECVCEEFTVKRSLFAELDAIASDSMVIASSTSSLLPSKLFEGLVHKAQMLVGHPINPPYFIPLIELVPSPWTNPAVLDRTQDLFRMLGQKPVILRKELPGFVLNRLQYSILNECYRLVANDIISVCDLDSIMTDGLGMRYAFLGPWETAHLNAPGGLEDYFQRYAEKIYEVSSSKEPVPKIQGPVAQKIVYELNQTCPVDKLDAKRKWRDERLVELLKIKRNAST